VVKLSILKRIVEAKSAGLEDRKRLLPLSAIEEMIERRTKSYDFAGAIGDRPVQIIAEVKKSSPSGGLLCSDFAPANIARRYAASGAAAVSILTEEKYFGGKIEDMVSIRSEVDIPLLRKDFVWDRYQVYESAAYGADAVLLIVALLRQHQLNELMSLSHHLGMDCLVEAHNENEVEMALSADAGIIGINNRDLDSFRVDIDTTRRLRDMIPDGKIVVSESGIRRRADMEQLKKWGVHAVLVGEALVASESIEEKMREIMI